MLNNIQIRSKLSHWMGELFEKDLSPDQVKEHIEKMSIKIASTKMKEQKITDDLLTNLCRQVENELKVKNEYK